MMFLIPYSLFFWLYIIAAGIVVLYGLCNLYHLLKFGFFSPTSVFSTFLLIAGAAIIIFISYKTLGQIDWNQSYDVGERINRWLHIFG